jgi:hypothetical protein
VGVEDVKPELILDLEGERERRTEEGRGDAGVRYCSAMSFIYLSVSPFTSSIRVKLKLLD